MPCQGMDMRMHCLPEDERLALCTEEKMMASGGMPVEKRCQTLLFD